MGNIKESYKRVRAELLGIDPVVMPLFCKLFYKPKKDQTAFLFDLLGKKKDFHFVQIGGNDGFANDPIFRFVKKYSWKGIIAEPQKEVFETRLSKTYRNEKNVILENVAIADKTETKPLYKLAVSNSRWATGLATFDYDVMLDRIQNNPRIKKRALAEGVSLPEKDEDMITSEDVQCITIKDLVEKHRIKQIHLLQIDTEGYDFEIIKTIDFNTTSPDMIAFERHLLSEKDQQSCAALLKESNYRLYNFGGDTVAVHQRINFDDSLLM